MSAHYSHLLPFGATYIAPDRTTFRLWAPTADGVEIVLEQGEAVPMIPESAAHGWFSATLACGAGTAYRYRVQSRTDGSLLVPDPAARAQQGDVHDASLVVDPHAYHWNHADWQGRPWHETVLYELHVGTMGGFAGVEKRLPELARMGFTAIELMPVADFPGARNWGYDGVLPFAPDAAYGTPEDLKSLIDSAHGLGLMVFLDVVYNHFGPDGNYLGSYAAPFFRQDDPTLWGHAIDFREPEVSDFFVQNALYWVHEYRFDGLRIDAAHAICEQDWLIALAQTIRARSTAIAPERQIHLVLEHDGNAAHFLKDNFNAQWNEDGHHVLHTMLTGERNAYYVDYTDRPAEKLARCLAEGFIYQGQSSVFRNGKPRGEPSAGLPPTAFVLFLQNHDQIGNRAFGDRLTTLANPRALQAAQALVLLSPQIPLVFMGEEVDARVPFFYFTSYTDPALAEAVRAGRYREFAASHEFADKKQREDIPDPNDPATFTRSIFSQSAPDNSGLMAALLTIRHTHIIPRLKGASASDAQALGPAAVAARWRMGDGAVLVIMINLDQHPVVISLEGLMRPAGADLLFATDDALKGVARGELEGYSIVVLLEPAP
ncbi:malto-oligosyltrehalose trehalohydrolase [Glaciimonas immobilis]|uniref:Malto-oligosyltrehalose trehalohydrolase n=1 Tax=Glaciimonas immobilis TaxID=728004 RepID=A0A840RRE2_9BURK|nr:malto-oligosyltrehalose trehalohydrolase [Glaciimonas immobilis]KAF3997786.1 malto-oligosyltrehalose trehalohydrolase [Glaciimonas immobilis]MBB5199546.1 maltooligosyltrehalose trehalohydrolase [Glaciimonas immobilis]